MRTHVARAFLALAGALGALALYGWGHKLLDVPLLAALGGALADLFAAGLVLLAGAGVGRGVLRRAGLGTSGRAVRVAVEGVVGSGLLAVAALLLALLGLLTPWGARGLLAATLLLTVRWGQAWARDGLAVLRRAWAAVPGGAGRALAVYSALLLLLALWPALAPPVGWDALMYHLLVPTQTLARGFVAYDPANLYTGFPHTGEMLYALALGVFGRTTAAAPLHAGFGVLALLAVGGTTCRASNATTAWLAVALLLSAPGLRALFGWAYVDLLVMACAACALALLSGPTLRRATLIVVGALVGLALGVKLTAAPLALAVAWVVLVRAPRRAAQNVLWVALAALVIYAPWGLRAWAHTGNPFFPLLIGGHGGVDAPRAALFSGAGQGQWNAPQAWHALALPLAATAFGFDRGAIYLFDPGPWLLTLPLLLPLGWPWLRAPARHQARVAVWLALPLLLAWALLLLSSLHGGQTRLAIALLPAAALLGALALAGLGGLVRPIRVGFVVGALVTFALGLGAVEAIRNASANGAGRVLLALLPPDAYRAQHLGTYALALDAIAALPPGAHVQFLWEPRTFGCPASHTCTPDVLNDVWARAIAAHADNPPAALGAWRTEGVTHLLLHEAGYRYALATLSRTPDADAQLLPALGAHTTPVWADGVDGYQLVALR